MLKCSMLKCSMLEPLVRPSLPRGGDARQRGQDARQRGPQGASALPTFEFTLFREGELMHGAALDDEVTVSSRHAAATAPG